MAGDIQSALESRISLGLLSLLARPAPPGLARPITNLIADGIAARRQSPMVRAIRANQWVVQGGSLDPAALDRAVRQNLRNIAWSLYLLYHYHKNSRAVQSIVHLDARMERLAKGPEFNSRGLILAGLHLCGFDLALRSACLQGLRPWVFTVPEPQGAHLTENEMRRRIGMTIVDPTSMEALRQAVTHLRQGGTLVTGIDRPLPNPSHHPRFFGRPAALPTHHVQIAAWAHVPVVVVTTLIHPDGAHQVITSDPIEMDTHFDHETEILCNAEKVLAVAEESIRKVPEHWSNINPVWPEI